MCQRGRGCGEDGGGGGSVGNGEGEGDGGREGVWERRGEEGCGEDGAPSDILARLFSFFVS